MTYGNKQAFVYRLPGVHNNRNHSFYWMSSKSLNKEQTEEDLCIQCQRQSFFKQGKVYNLAPICHCSSLVRHRWNRALLSSSNMQLNLLLLKDNILQWKKKDFDTLIGCQPLIVQTGYRVASLESKWTKVDMWWHVMKKLYLLSIVRCG